MIPHVFSQPELLKISVFEAHTWRFPPHRHTHYELIYILAGSGEHVINAQGYPYQAGDLFLFNTRDVHCFTIMESTRFCVVKMSPGFLQTGYLSLAEWQELLEAERVHEQPALDPTAKAYVTQQLAFCLQEYAHQRPRYERILQGGLLSVLLLLCRAYAQQQPAGGLPSEPACPLTTRLVGYVQHHVKEPPRLNAGALARHFHLSPHYLGQYFRRHLGRSLKRYVDECRVHALRQELRFGTDTISQLAIAYGFADGSHLSRVFRAIAQQTPTCYRLSWTKPGSAVKMPQLPAQTCCKAPICC